MSRGDEHRQGGKRRPIHLRAHAGATPAAEDGPYVLERLSALGHELENLLDGAIRCLTMTRRSLQSAAGRLSEAEIDTALGQITTVQVALEHMAEQVSAAMRGATGRGVTLGEAIAHAAEILAPLAADHAVEVRLWVDEQVTGTDVGPLYPVILNALRNAIEAASRGSPRSADRGTVEVRASPREIEGHARRRFIALEVFDDGVGISSPREGRRAMIPGVTSKPGRLGLGLAIASEVVREMGGAIELRRREDRADATRPGAVLRVVYPRPDEGEEG